MSWSKGGKAWGFDSDKGLDTFLAAARDSTVNGSDWFKTGDARAELPKSATAMEAEYLCDYAYHAQMEPLNAVASVSAAGDSAEIWVGTQSQSNAQEATAKALGITRDKVKLHDLLLGGGFGRRGPRDMDFLIDAVLLAKEAGRPVKVMCRRTASKPASTPPANSWRGTIAWSATGSRRTSIRCATSAPARRTSS